MSNVLDIELGSPAMEEQWRAKGGFNASCCFTIHHRLPAVPDADDEWGPVEAGLDGSIVVQCPRVYDVLLWVTPFATLIHAIFNAISRRFNGVLMRLWW